MLCRSTLVRITVIFFILSVYLWAGKQCQAGGTTKFNDIKGHWAEQSMLELNAYGIVHGYPDDQFKPNRPVSFEEVVVMILNTIGLGKEAAKADLSDLKFPPGVSWSKGYLALAVERGMLTREGLPKLDPKRSATRWEVASLLCLALDLEPDYNPLPFTDAEEINQNYRGYVGAVVKKGIMRGLPGKKFAPNMDVSRAQICAILQRVIDEKWVAPPPPMQRLVGWVKEINLDLLTLKSITGEKQVTLPPDCTLVKKGQTVSSNLLEKGDRIKIITDSSDQVRYATILDEYGPASKTEEGFVLSLSLKENDYHLALETDSKEELSFALYDDAQLIKNGQELTVADIRVDSYAEVFLDDRGSVFKMEIFEPEKITGSLIETKRTGLKIKTRGIEKDYNVSSHVRVTRNIIRDMKYSDLKKGDWVELLVLKNTVFYINSLSDIITVLSGIVSKVEDKAVYVYVQNKEVRYDLGEQVEILKEGRLISSSMLKRGDLISFEVDNNHRIVSIEVLTEDTGEYEGTVRYLTISNQPSLTFVITGGLELDYDIAGNAELLKYGDEINLEDILPGARAKITIKDGKIVKIDILDDRNITIKGYITNINAEHNRITLEINQRKYTYNLAQDLQITDKHGKTIKLSELEGYPVEVTLKDGVVVELKTL